MKFCVTYRFLLLKREQKRENLLFLSADYPDYCGLDLISLLDEKALFWHLFDHDATVHRLCRTVIIVMHGVGKFLKLRFRKRQRMFQYQPGYAF